MSDPHAQSIPIFGDRFQTIYYTEGTGVALVVTRVKSRMRQKERPMANAEAALAWAKAHQAGMVYLPAGAIGGN